MKIVQSFKEYLTESQYKTKISDEEFLKLLKEKCSDALQNGKDTPIVRGMSGGEEAVIIQGEAGGRESANTSNYYTIFLDHTLGPKGYPKRSKSIICSNWRNRDYSNSFAENYVFAIIPYNGVKIGVCPDYDMWETEFKHGPDSIIGNRIESLNRAFKWAGIPQTTFDDAVKAIEKLLENEKLPIEDNPNDENHIFLAKMFKEGKVREQLEKMYNEDMGFSLHTTKTVYEIDEPREVWIGGKCLAIPLERYQNLIENL